MAGGGLVCQFKRELAALLLGIDVDSVNEKLVNLIRTCDNPSTGDFVLPSFDNSKVWGENQKRKSETDVINASSDFALKIEKIVINPKNTAVFLNRKTTFQNFFSSDVIMRIDNVNIKVINYEKLKPNSSSLSIVRCAAVTSVICHLLDRCSMLATGSATVGVSCSDKRHLLQQMSTQPQQGQPLSCVAVNVGNVVTPSECPDILTLVALAREQLEVVETMRDGEGGNIPQLAAAEVQYRLLSSTVSQPVVLDLQKQSAVSFILYNCARIKKILRVFEKNVKKGVYPPLPPPDQVDWEVLTEDEEWLLVHVYLLQYAPLLRSLSQSLLRDGQLASHRLAQFLSGLSRCYSRYYSRVRVLRDGSPVARVLHVMAARIHLVKHTLAVIEDGLSILDINSVNRM